MRAQKVNFVGSYVRLSGQSFERLHESVSLLICPFYALLDFEKLIGGLRRFEYCGLLSDVFCRHIHADASVRTLNTRKNLTTDVRLLFVENAKILVALNSSIGRIPLAFMSHLPARLCTRLPILYHGCAHSRRGLSSASRMLQSVLRLKVLLADSKLLVQMLVMVLILGVNEVLHSLFQRTLRLASRILVTWVSAVGFPARHFFHRGGVLDVSDGEIPLGLAHHVTIFLEIVHVLREHSFTILIDGLFPEWNIHKWHIDAIWVRLIKPMLKQTVSSLDIHRSLRGFHSFSHSVFEFVGLAKLLVALENAYFLGVVWWRLLAFTQLINSRTFLSLNNIFVISALYLGHHWLRSQMKFLYLRLEVFPLQSGFVVTCRRDPLDLLLKNFFRLLVLLYLFFCCPGHFFFDSLSTLWKQLVRHFFVNETQVVDLEVLALVDNYFNGRFWFFFAKAETLRLVSNKHGPRAQCVIKVFFFFIFLNYFCWLVSCKKHHPIL